MFIILRRSIACLLSMIIITGIIYPLFVTLIGNCIFPQQSQGSLIIKDGKILGSELIGQSFQSPKYFWSRPSATTPVSYNAAASGGSNLGPTNPALIKLVQDNIAKLKAADPENKLPVPADLVTASGSGLDPDISLAAAEYQIPRVARARKINEIEVRELVARYARGRQLGILGEPRINVLKLNLALDAREK
jgi:potassium-transporting ATPase KdpC subunit